MDPIPPIETDNRPWEDLSRLLAADSTSEACSFLETLPPGEAMLAVSRVDPEEQTRLLACMPTPQSARLIQEIPHANAADILGRLSPGTAATIIGQLPSDVQADLLGDLSPQVAEAILETFSPAVATRLRDLSEYEDEEAGGLMITEYMAYPAGFRTHDVIEDIRRHVEAYARFPSQYLFVVDQAKRLVGVLRMRDLLLARREARIETFMIPDPHTIGHHASLRELGDFFDHHAFLGVPVVDEERRLVGVVTRADFNEAWGEHNEEDYRKSQGLVEEELRSMPLWRRTRGRLMWLSVNILLNIIAASVIAAKQDTLQAVIALAVFLPIISDMSGCSGNQAVAVSMRELTLGLVRPGELWRVLRQEMWVGLLNGLLLGLLIGVVAWLWKSNVWLGLVVGGALALNTVLAVCVGGTIPLLLKKLKRDPALASGPILTTITDMCGFFLVLTFAGLVLDRLL